MRYSLATKMKKKISNRVYLYGKRNETKEQTGKKNEKRKPRETRNTENKYNIMQMQKSYELVMRYSKRQLNALNCNIKLYTQKNIITTEKY